jgi:hypothetical protein
MHALLKEIANNRSTIGIHFHGYVSLIVPVLRASEVPKIHTLFHFFGWLREGSSLCEHYLIQECDDIFSFKRV